MPALLQMLHTQLTGMPLPDSAAANERVALEMLEAAAAEQSVLLVLDDIWDESHAKALSFVGGSTTSRLLVTTRIRSLYAGASEVHCETLSKEKSLELLLRVGGYEDLLDSPPATALEAVELCGCLPLALGIAGGIIAELSDRWQEELLPLLKDEIMDASVEERVLTASLRAVPEEMRPGVNALFAVFAVFAEEAIVPAAVLDTIAPLVAGAGLAESAPPNPDEVLSRKMKSTKMVVVEEDQEQSSAEEVVQQQKEQILQAIQQQQERKQEEDQVRSSLQYLLQLNIVRGSIEGGVSVHDLVRECMIGRAEEACEGGLRAMQRAVVRLLLDAFNQEGSVADSLPHYVAVNLYWHVRQAQMRDVPVPGDALLMRALTHSVVAIRAQAALGVGVGVLRERADACDAICEHLSAAWLMYAASAVRGQASGAELRRAWTSLRELEHDGDGSEESRQLESLILNALVIATDGGFAHGSAEHMAVLDRMVALGNRSGSDKMPSEKSDDTATDKSKEVMETEINSGTPSLVKGAMLEGTTGYPGPMTDELLQEAHSHWRQAAQHYANAAFAAPHKAQANVAWSLCQMTVTARARQHRLSEFDFELHCGTGGERLHDTIET